MDNSLFRLFVERKEGFRNSTQRLLDELKDFVGISGITGLRYLNRYDIEGLSREELEKSSRVIFSEAQSDELFFDKLPVQPNQKVIAVEYVPGQYDQRADSAQQCIKLITKGVSATVKCGRIYVLSGEISDNDLNAIKKYLINPVDSREASLDMPQTLALHSQEPADIPVLNGFINISDTEASDLQKKMNLAMDAADVCFTRDYFSSIKRDPTETEIRVLDTYWSDHCRHTTFNTILDKIEIEDGKYSEPIKAALKKYSAIRAEVYATRKGGSKSITLMDMATIGAKILKKQGFLDDIEESAEINACSIHITVKYEDGSSEPWLLMFKNETHNHPTEIEPFGGAATCIGGAIRDPLSGRSWVYQAMRITGAGDPHTSLEETLPGKLPQIKLTREAAAGYSSYGNQIGLATGQVAEIYDPGFVAKRMELGAVIAAVPESWVVREEPQPGDVVVLLGGGTGRDGIGGATGSSKAHTEKSLSTAGAEVQKGNAVEERKIQRLFRNPDVTKLIKRCNDFGAGGVSVAIGELAEGLEINLDIVPKKYEGLNGTEIAISESQERMAVVVRKTDAQTFMEYCSKENLNSVIAATVTDSGRLIMNWRGKPIVDIERSFLDTNGANRSANAVITTPEDNACPLSISLPGSVLPSVQLLLKASFPDAWLANLSDLAVASQKGIEERFDGTIGASSILFPYGGKYQLTPEAGMVAKIPALYPKESKTVSIMTYGYDPKITEWSPFHGAQYSILDSLAKVLVLGGDPSKARLTFQEFFEKTSTPEAWGKPTSALLGALVAQDAMKTASIGGKDSMSGSFGSMHVPPTLVSFAVATTDEDNIVSASFKDTDCIVCLAKMPITNEKTPDWESFKENAKLFTKLNSFGIISSAYTIGTGGLAAAISKMCFGNRIGFSCTLPQLNEIGNVPDLFIPQYGSVLIQLKKDLTSEQKNIIEEVLSNKNWTQIGTTCDKPVISIAETEISIERAQHAWESKLEDIFPVTTPNKTVDPEEEKTVNKTPLFTSGIQNSTKFVTEVSKPLAVLPVFPGTNCEYDMARAFELAGARTKMVLIRNRTQADISQSLKEFSEALAEAQIFALSGGFSAGDEPDGSGKYIANILREQSIKERILDLLENKKGLILGICNGFQALVKTGLLPYGKILVPDDNMPTLTFNNIGRHISRVVTTRIVSNMSPWATELEPGQLHSVPVSHGEGRLIVNAEEAQKLFNNGQVFTQYTDLNGIPTMKEPWNPNGSEFAIEGLTSPCGRILGKMGHSERTIGFNEGITPLLKNIPGNKIQNIFVSGVKYFK